MANIYAEQNYLLMSRSKNKVKAPVKTSIPFGKLTPIGLPLDVLPGSTVKMDMANITRMLTPIAPIMDDISMDVYSFFIPWRVLYSKTKNFFGENDQVAWTLVTDEKLPHIVIDCSTLDGVYTTSDADFLSGNYLYLVDSSRHVLLKSVFAGTLFDFFGLPFVYPSYKQIIAMQTQFLTDDSLEISFQAMPFRGMQAIYNEFFRNENVSDPILDLNYDGLDFYIDVCDICLLYKDPTDESSSLSYRFWWLPGVARWKDLFTSLNPAPQRGPAVALPLGNMAPVKTSAADVLSQNNIPLRMYLGEPLLENRFGVTLGIDVPQASPGHAGDPIGNQNVGGYGDINTSFDDMIVGGPSNLYADLSNVTMATVNQIRYAFATQRYYEKLARSGARYHEYLRVMFGVRPSDAVLQRPQFLGGHHEHINISQVLQTSETSSTPLGSTGAYSVTGFKTHNFTNSFNEFGIIMNLVCIRKQHSYCQGLDKYWTKRDVWDIYNPTFAHIGEVAVDVSEVYWTPENVKEKKVLGYNEAWYEYRSVRSLTCGLLNPLAPENLASFVLTDVYEDEPTLDDAFILEDPKGLDRVLVASAEYTNQFICDFLIYYTISAVMPVHSTPGLIDHY